MTRSELRRELLQVGLLLATGVDGVYGRSQRFEEVVAAVDRHAAAVLGSERDEVIRFPPVMPRTTMVATGYVHSFPHLLGSIHSFAGDERAHGELVAAAEAGGDWGSGLTATDVVLEPAVCHPVYPQCRGTLPPGGRRFDVAGWCFRHEPSPDPARLQSFRMHEWVAVGAPEAIGEQRDEWVAEASALLVELGLAIEAVVANDPFFGRGGRMLAASQREEGLKLELVTPIGAGEPVAVASCNRHLDHFGTAFAIELAPGLPAHSACVGLGLERVVLALLDTHGLDPEQWPPAVRERLWP